MGGEAALEAEEEATGGEDITLDIDIAQEGGQLGEGELDFADVDALELDGTVEVLLVIVADGGLAEVQLAVMGEVKGSAGDGGVCDSSGIQINQAQSVTVVVGDAGIGGTEIHADTHGRPFARNPGGSIRTDQGNQYSESLTWRAGACFRATGPSPPHRAKRCAFQRDFHFAI